MDSDQLSRLYRSNLERGIRNLLQIQGGGKALAAEKVWIEPAEGTLTDWGKLKLQRRTYKAPVYGSLVLKDKSGKILDRQKKMLLGYVPEPGPFSSFLVSGNEYFVPAQFRIKPGVYHREREDGTLEAWVNTAEGRSLKIHFDPEEEDFKLEAAGKSVPLFPVLVSLGMGRQGLSQYFGKALVDKLEEKYSGSKAMDSSLSKLHEILTGKAASGKDAADSIHAYWSERQGALDPNITEKTVGMRSSAVTPELLAAAAGKVLSIFRGSADPDDRDSLEFKQSVLFHETIPQRYEHRGASGALRRKIGLRMERLDDIRSILPSGYVTRPVMDFFLSQGGSLASGGNESNVLSLVNAADKTTLLGEGGISSDDAVVANMRDLHPSKMGIIDPVFTPDSEKIGVVEHLTVGAVYNQEKKRFETQVWDRKAGKPVYVSPAEAIAAGAAMVDQFVWKNGKPFPKKKLLSAYSEGGKLGPVDESKVRYVFHKPENLFSVATNSIPFLTANSGPRAMMAAKMMEQASPLKRENREAPLVQSVDSDGIPFDRYFLEGGKEPFKNHALMRRATEDGVVIKAGRGAIVVKSGRKTQTYDLFDTYPLSSKTYIQSEPLVRKGDKVKKGQLLADLNVTKDGSFAAGTHLNVAYMPWKGMTLDDGVVISGSAARKMTSEHLYRLELPLDSQTVLSRSKYLSTFPENARTGVVNKDKYDEDGIVRVGEKVKPSEIIAMVMHKVTAGPIADVYTALKRKAGGHADASMTWDRPMEGEVVNVNKTPSSIEIAIRTDEPMEVGDKISGRFGNKGIVTAVIPDHEMPRDASGNPVEVIIDPVSVPGRTNLGQIFETVAAKVARKTGKPFRVYNFQDESFLDTVSEAAKKAGVKDKEPLFDPSGKPLGNILVGPQFFMRLQHRASLKMSARDRAGYDIDNTPMHGGSEAGKAKGADRMILYAMLAHGAKANLQEMNILKGTKNEEYWRALEGGGALPPLKTPFVMDKFLSLLKAAGVNASKSGTNMKLMPLTDQETLDLSSGEIKKPVMLRAKDLKEEPGGLFDPALTGGIEGRSYTHITLPEPMPNPVFENAIAQILNIRKKDIADIVAGRAGLGKDGRLEPPTDANTGGKAIADALANVDVKKALKETKDKLSKVDLAKNPALASKWNRKARYLQNLHDLDVSAKDAYISSVLPVIPPVFRPVYALPDGNIETSDLNYLYRDIGIMSEQLKKAQQMTSDDRNDAREALYDAMKAHVGLTQPSYGRPLKGVLETIGGSDGPKRGFFQDKLLRKEQDMSGRSVIVPNPELGPDEAEIPEEMAWKIYRPLIIAKLTSMGFKPLAASDNVDKRTDMAQRAISLVMQEHPVLLNRAPTLHKFSVMAFKPKIWKGSTIRIPHLVVRGLNADFDGDEMSVFVPVSKKAAKEAAALLPTANLFNPGSMDLMLMPSHSTLYGLYYASRPGAGKPVRVSDPMDVRQKMDSGALRANSPVTFRGIQTTAGLVVFNELLPAGERDYVNQLDSKSIRNLLTSMAKKQPSEYGRVVSSMKRLGDEWASESGLTVGLEDLRPVAQKTNLLAPMLKARTAKEIIEMGNRISGEANKITTAAGTKSSIAEMLRSGAIGGGKRSQARQILVAPIMSQNFFRQPVAHPIASSYSEGLTPTDYWAASFGARAGMMDRSLATSLPGAFSKEVMASNVHMTIVEEDCGTRNGVEVSTDDSFLAGRLLSEYAGGYPRNTIVTVEVIKNLMEGRTRSVKVRSPATCESSGGVCQKCYGLMENGQFPQIGENIGAIAGASITEPLTQMAMTGFHTSGVSEGGGGILTGAPAIFQLLRLPSMIANGAVLSRKDGKVLSITETPAGRSAIDIGGAVHYAPPNMPLRVKKGDIVRKNQPLTGGVIHPRAILESEGVEAFRKYLSSSLSETYAAQNKKIHPRHFETVARSLSSYATVTDPGKSSLLKGDIVPIHKIPAGVSAEPILRGVNAAPLLSSDWLARMGYQQLGKTIQEGAARGWESNIGEYGHPIASYVYGTEFFKNDSPAIRRLDAAWNQNIRKTKAA